MTLVIPPGYAECAFKFALNGDSEVMISTVGVNFNEMACGNEENADAVADAFLSAWPAPTMFVGWNYLGVSARVGIGGGDTIPIDAPRAVAGTRAGSSPPQNCALLVKKISAISGRQARGRFFWPCFGVDETAVSQSGVIDSVTLGGLQAAFTALFNHGEPWVILHNDTPDPGMPPTPVSAFIVDRTLATVRRRLRR